MEANYYSYHVTRDGRIFNKFGKQLSPSDNGKGYLIVGITHEGKRFTKAIHRVVAEVYVPNPECLSDVNHKDCNRRHNYESNLEWLTHGDNIKYSYDNDKRSALGSNNANAKHDDFDVHNICYLLEQGFSNSMIRDMGYGYNTVAEIKRRSKWEHIASDYKF